MEVAGEEARGGWVKEKSDKAGHKELTSFLGVWQELGVVQGTETGSVFVPDAG